MNTTIDSHSNTSHAINPTTPTPAEASGPQRSFTLDEYLALPREQETWLIRPLIPVGGTVNQIERALKPDSVTVNKRQLVVPNCARLLISAPTDAKEAEAAIQRALSGTKLFANANVRFNEHKKEFVAMIESTGLATYADAAGALEACGPGYKVTDMVWTAPCASCSKAGCVQANCKGCWKEG